MIRVTVSPGPSPWLCRIESPYSDTIRAAFHPIPGIQWNKGHHAYFGPWEIVLPILHKLQQAKVIAIHGDTVAAMPNPGAYTKIHCHPSSYPFQTHGSAWLAHHLSYSGAALLADEMGLGKSIQALNALSHHDKPFLVVAPAVVVPHWTTQVIKWGASELNPMILSYEKFTKAVKASTLGPFATVVFDEAHYLANPKAQRTQAAQHYVGSHSPSLILLTGTPILSRVRDLYSLLNLMHPGRWGSKFDFERRYAAGHMEEIKGLDRNVWVADGHSNEAELNARLAHVMLRRTKAEVAIQLPTRIRTVHEVEIPKAALKALAKASAAIRIHDDAKQGISTILQGIEEYKVKFAHDLAVEIRDSGGRPLILTLRKDTAAKLGSMLSCPVVTGDTSVDHRAAMLCASDCGVATLYSVTTGIDLTHFDSIIMVGLDWLPSTILQGEARIHRIGSQYASISIHYLIGRGTLDEVVRERVLERLDTFSAVIGTGDEAVFAEELGGGNEEDLIASFLERLRT